MGRPPSNGPYRSPQLNPLPAQAPPPHRSPPLRRAAETAQGPAHGLAPPFSFFVSPGPKISRELAGKPRVRGPRASSAALAVFARDCFLPPSPASPLAFLPVFPARPPPPSPAGPLPAGIIWSPAMDSPSAGQFPAAAAVALAAGGVRCRPPWPLLCFSYGHRGGGGSGGGLPRSTGLGRSPFGAEAAKARPPRPRLAHERGGKSSAGRGPLLDVGSLRVPGSNTWGRDKPTSSSTRPFPLCERGGGETWVPRVWVSRCWVVHCTQQPGVPSLSLLLDVE